MDIPAALTTLSPSQQLALDTIHRRPTKGVPTWLLHIMQQSYIERLAGLPPGSYRKDPVNTYLGMQYAIGVNFIDQFIPTNPQSMGDRGYEGATKGTTTGGADPVLDGIVINSPEAVVEHLERFAFPALEKQAREFDEDKRCQDLLAAERQVQGQLGAGILKVPYGCVRFPGLRYGQYGYIHYFTTFALYRDVIARDFKLQADVALRNNRAVARAWQLGRLPPLLRLDHDMADGKGTLVNIKWLDQIWFPEFARCLAPMLATGVNMIWHCDGNLMQMVPRLLEVGLSGFQGFQYEFGMDYEKICRLKTRDGRDQIIIAGVSVTQTLPNGKPADVRRELDWLVAHGPRTGLFLGGSSSIVPGTPWENIKTLVEGVQYYRTHGRG